MSPAPACPVCLAAAARAFLTIQGRDYWRCTECGATFLEPTQRPDAAAERAHYDSHRNEIDDPGYRRFLARLTVPLLERLAPGSRVLDYGCGPGPALAAMLTEAGHDVCLYDPFYQPDTAVLEGSYDAITCTEVVEHFHEPMQELVRLRALLRPGGLLGIMTCFQTDDTRFADWHYRRDPTHVVFYKEATLRHLAALLGLAIDVPARDVAILRKPTAS